MLEDGYKKRYPCSFNPTSLHFLALDHYLIKMSNNSCSAPEGHEGHLVMEVWSTSPNLQCTPEAQSSRMLKTSPCCCSLLQLAQWEEMPFFFSNEINPSATTGKQVNSWDSNPYHNRGFCFLLLHTFTLLLCTHCLISLEKKQRKTSELDLQLGFGG